ncbi:MAG: hypothetical protein M1836_000520 [Candelina mexicana]|nr:MAG: hypothetical protein M1836_000520 [Candelina mexicana]
MSNTQLLASPAFHRAVQRVHKKVRQIQHGKDPEDMGGTNIDSTDPSETKKFIHYYIDELKEQIRGTPPKK